MNCDYDSVVGVILPVVENKILLIVHLILKLTKTHPLFFALFAKNTADEFLPVVKVAAPLLPLFLCRINLPNSTRSLSCSAPSFSTASNLKKNSSRVNLFLFLYN